MASFNSKQIRELPKTATSSTTISEKELRDQLHQEIEKKSKACSNPTFMCSLPRLDGYDYCLKHILRDASAPYRQCTFIYPNGRKCINAVLKHDIKKDPALTTLCFEHSRQAQLRKTRAVVGKLMNADSNEVHLHNLAHHVKVDETAKKVVQSEQEEEIDVVSPFVPPFLGYEKTQELSSVSMAMKKHRRILDYASDSSSNEEAPCFNNTARGHELQESDAESVDDDDYLKYAGIFTREEVVRITKNKLIKLQSLYIDQLDYLHHLLKEKRRRYLHDVRKEREIYCSIHDQVKDTPKENKQYNQLKALNTYHRRHGVEAILYKKFKEKRTRATDGYVPKGPGVTKCVYTEGGVKCGERAMPCCKFCRKHILEDKKQCLFRACSVEKSGIICQEPIPCISDDATCVLHIPLPPKRQYIQKKFESETEEEDVTIKAEILTPIKKERLSHRAAILMETSPVESYEVNDESMDVKPLISENGNVVERKVGEIKSFSDVTRKPVSDNINIKKELKQDREDKFLDVKILSDTKTPKDSKESQEIKGSIEIKDGTKQLKNSTSSTMFDFETPSTSKAAKAAEISKKGPNVKELIVINSKRKRPIKRVSVVKREEVIKKVPVVRKITPTVHLKKVKIDSKRQRIKILIDPKRNSRNARIKAARAKLASHTHRMPITADSVQKTND